MFPRIEDFDEKPKKPSSRMMGSNTDANKRHTLDKLNRPPALSIDCSFEVIASCKYGEDVIGPRIAKKIRVEYFKCF